MDAIAQWHHFAPATFGLGRDQLALDEATSIGLYDARVVSRRPTVLASGIRRSGGAGR